MEVQGKWLDLGIPYTGFCAGCKARPSEWQSGTTPSVAEAPAERREQPSGCVMSTAVVHGTAKRGQVEGKRDELPPATGSEAAGRRAVSTAARPDAQNDGRLNGQTPFPGPCSICPHALGRRTAFHAAMPNALSAFRIMSPRHTFGFSFHSRWDPDFRVLYSICQQALGDEDYELAEMFNENKVTIDPQGHGSPVIYLIREGYLAEPEFIPVQVEMDVSLSEPSNSQDYNETDLQRIGNSAAWTEKVVEIAMAASRRHQRIIVFCPSVQCARESANIVSAQGLRGVSVVADTPDDQRRTIISTFRNDDDMPMAIFNYGVLTAGFDAPRTRCVIVARPTTSLVLYSQMVGRAMRGPRSGGNRRCQIYTVVDTQLSGFASVVDAFNNWEELWRSQN